MVSSLRAPTAQEPQARHPPGSVDLDPATWLEGAACVQDLVEAQVERTPDAVAVEHGDERVSYGELNARANRIAHHLRALGVGPEARVGVALSRSVAAVAAILGALKAGGAYVPLDPAYPAQRLAFMLADAGIRVLLTERALRPLFPEVGATVVCLDDDDGALQAAPSGDPERLATAESLAYVIYTSGSTGRSKGVAMPHRPLLNLIAWQLGSQASLGPARTLHFASPSFDVSFQEIFCTWSSGGALIIVPEEVRRDPPALARLLVEREVERAYFPPIVLRHLAEAIEREGAVPARLREIIVAGEALQITGPIAALLGRLDGCVLQNHYGPTETHVVTAFTVPAPVAVGTPSIGRPIAGTQIHLLDAGLTPVPAGEPGELYVGGVAPARGYLGRPELTAERFIADPFGGGGRLYRTGDRCRWQADGTLEFLGRVDHQVKIRGFRIELGEIEAALAEHPAVGHAVAAVREEAPGDKRLVAYLVARDPASPPPTGELRGHLAAKLPEHMVPAAFVLLDALPLLPSGKLDRAALPAPPAGGGRAPARARTPVEEVLAGIWADVLRLPGVDVEEDFFALGGHSLHATQVMARVSRVSGVELPVRALFEAPTVALLAARVEAARGSGRPPAPPLSPRRRQGELPLSPAQQQLWLVDRLDPGSSTYNVPLAVRLDGTLDVGVLERSLAEIVRRHEALRTTFVTVDGEPRQVIAAPSFSLPVVDLTALIEAAREAEAQRLAVEDARRPFDLARGPLFRATLLRLEARAHVLLMGMHHVVSDGWSLGVLTGELSALYEAFSAGRPSPLPELAVQVADVAVWQRAWLSGEVLDAQLGYWRAQLSGAPAALDLPTDRPRPVAQSFRGATHRFLLPRELAAALASLCRREGVTPFMALLAAFQVLLHRYSGQDDVVVGTAIAGRTRVEMEGLIGSFVNTLALRASLAGDPTFRELLGRVREVTLGAYAHQDVPFDRLVEALSPARDLGRSPVFQAMLVLETPAAARPSLGEASLRSFEVERGTSRVDLTLAILETDDGLAAALEYATDLFDAATIERMAGHLRVLLEGAVEGPARRASELPLLTADERRTLLVTWNDTAADLPREACAHALFEARADETPDAVALVHEGRALTYRALDEQSNRVAHHLIALGAGPGALVGVALERSAGMVVAVLGILKAGAAYLPLDPTYPKARLSFMLRDAGVGLLVTEERLAGSLPEHGGRLVRLDADEGALAAREAGRPAAHATAGDRAYVIYTSGSTGQPKGVEISHRALVNFLGAMRARPGLSAGDRLLAVTSLSFDIAGLELFLPLSVGARVVIASRAAVRDGAALRRHVDEDGITVMQATPSTWRLLLDAGWQGGAGLRVLVGGEAVPRDLVDALAARAGAVWNMYGPTETTIWSCIHPLSAGAGPVPIGRPIANTRAYVLDGHASPAPVGVPGELYLGGAGVARGYLGRPELCAARFVPDPFDARGGGRLYRTGDLCRWRSDGTLEFLGRVDQQVKLRGYRIELGEIEAALSAHPGVRQAVVALRVETPGDPRLVAYLVARDPSSPPAVAALRGHLQATLPDYLVPAVFAWLDALPLTPNGKIDRKALPSPSAASPGDERAFVAPRTPAEEVLAGIWAEVLGLDRVSVHDDFFALGGHSLLGTRVMARLGPAFGVEVPLRALFEAPTVALLATRVEGARQGGDRPASPPIPRARRDVATPLSFAQQRLWLLDRIEPGSDAYNIPMAVRLDGVLDAGALERSLAEIVRRHEALRTTFATADGEPRQVIGAPAFSLPVIDLGALPGAAREAEARRLADDDATRPFDLSSGPLFRAALVRLAAGAHVLLVCLHHTISDGWSLGVLMRELSALYEAFSAGRPSPLPELPIQYVDYAVWQRGWLSGEVLEEQLAYWKRQLAGAPPFLELPTVRARPPVQTHHGAACEAQLSPELTAALEALCRREGVTLFMALLAAFQALLHRYSGQPDVVVGSPIAGRTRVETGALVGFFVNTLVLRTDLGGDPSFRALLARVREVTLGAYAHQDLPFEKLVEELAPPRDLGRTPLFQVFFNMLNLPPMQAALPGLSATTWERAEDVAKFDLNLYAAPRDGGIFLSLVHNTDLFDALQMGAMLDHLGELVRGIVADPERPLSRIALSLPAACRAPAVTIKGRPGPRFEPFVEEATAQSIGERFAEQARRRGSKAAIRTSAGEVSYAALAAHAARVALALGPGRGRVALLFRPGPSMVAGILGALEAGAAYVPLDLASPPGRLLAMLDDAVVAALLTHTPCLAQARALAPPGCPVLDVDALEVDGLEVAAALAAPASRVPVGPDDLAYILYTSGSTGRPKGVAQSHRNVLRHLRNYTNRLFIDADDTLSLVASYASDAGVQDILGALLAGAAVCPIDVRDDGLLHLPQRLREHGVTLYHSTPTVYRHLLTMLGETEVLEGIRRVVLGGEAARGSDVASFRRHFRSDCVFVNGYGLTESTMALHYQVDEETSVPGETVPVGYAVEGAQVSLEQAGGEQVAVYGMGEIVLRSDALSLGYWQRAERTAAGFALDGEDPGRRVLRTGDLGRRLPGGALEVVGRRDHQVKIRGNRVELGEIEVVLGLHPALKQAVVVAAPGEGPDDTRLVAHLVAREGRPSADELRAYLRARVPEYMIPSAWAWREAMPLLPGGKIDRRALPSAVVGPPAGERATARPRSPTEEVLAGIWADVLGLDRVTAHDDFFALGGHSLLATRVMARLGPAFRIELPLRALFEAPTVARLAEWIDAARQTGERPAPSPITPAPRGGALPLSFAQQRLWVMDRLEPGSATYNLPLAAHIEGALDTAALERSLLEIVRRHETLRTTFAAVDGEPLQVIAAEPSLSMPLVDLRALPRSEQEAEVVRLATDHARRPFDLSRGPLFRAALLQLGEARHVLLLAMHHIVSDGWSLGLLTEELSTIYAALAAGRPSPLPELQVQYADHARWQREWLSGAVLEGQLAYWKGQLRGAPPALDLPTDRPRPAVQGHRGATHRFTFPRELSTSLAALCRRERVTMFMALLAGFQVLLHRYTGQEDIVVGTAIAGRTRAEVEALVGFFVNTLVLRGDLGGDPTFRELLARVREVTLDAYAHQDVPFEKLVEELAPVRDLGRSPLFQAMLVLQHLPEDFPPLGEARLSPIEVETGTSMFDLTLSVLETAQGIAGELRYATDLFDEATIARMAGHLRLLLEGAVTDSARAISALPMLGAEESRRILVAWNDTARPFPQQTCLHEMFEAQADRTPEATAAVFGRERITYGELDRRANRLANHLRTLGVEPEVLVGLCVERSLDMLVAILGILKAGGAYVPMDPAYPRERLAFTLEDSRAPVVVTERRALAALPEHGARVVLLDAERARIDAESDARPASGVGPRNLAYALFTSGSTGRPKGVAIEHRSPVALVAWAGDVYGPRDHEGTLFATSMCFDLSIFEIFVPLSAGGKVIVAQNALELPALPAAAEVTMINTVPSAMAELLRVGGVPAGVRTVNLAGEPLPHALAQRIYAVPTISRLCNLYGPTEDTTYSTFAEGRPETGLAPPIGRPIANGTAYVLDRRRSPVPVGVAGEIYLGGAGLARGYLHRPELTAERFVDNPFGEGRLYRTGDLGRHLPDGTLEYLGRIDHQVKVRGFRIELGEIEAVLAEHPGVREVVALAREDVPGDKRLVAYVTCVAERPSSDELRALARKKLPEHMVPAVFVILDALPLTPSGKVDRKALPAPAGRSEQEQGYLAPRTPAEEVLAGIWAEVLGLDRVGVHDDFFALGGHSLLGMRVIARLGPAFGVEVPLRALFEAPTVALLARRVEGARQGGDRPASPPIPRARRDAAPPLSFAQQRLWLLDQIEPGSPAYHMTLAVRLDGALDAGALERSLAEIVRRHEALRTTFATADGEPRQVIGAPAFSLPVIDLGALPEAAREAEARRRVDDDATRPFDLSRGPLLRTALLRLAAGAHVLSMTVHHAVSDGWSLGVLTRELSTLYEAFSAGRPSPLPELPIQYVDYAVWQRGWLSGEVLEEQFAYWKQELAGAPPFLELPTVRARPPVQTHHGAACEAQLSPELTAALEALCRREGVTLFMALLAAFQALLHRYSGQPDVVVGSPIAGRTRAETEGLVGFFVNTLVLRTDLGGDPSFRALLARAREVTLGAYAHQDLPFEKLVEELAPPRDLGRTPLFQVFFNMLNLDSDWHDLPGLSAARWERAGVTAKFDLNLYVEERGGGAALHLVYNTDLFDALQIEAMLDHLGELVRGIVADPERPLSRIALSLPAACRAPAVTIKGRPGPRFEPFVEEATAQSIGERFAEQARRRGSKAAIRTSAGEVSYAALAAHAARVAVALGPGRGRVALLFTPGPSMVAGILGALEAGAAYVPLDLASPPGRLLAMLDDAVVAALLTHTPCLAQARALAPPGCPVLDVDALEVDGLEVAAPASRVPVGPDDLAYILYTSGSTGRPKGVAQSHRNVLRHLRNYTNRLFIDADDTLSLVASYASDAGVQDILGALLAGAAVCPIDVRDDGLLHLPQRLREHGVTLYHSTPTVYRHLLTMLGETEVLEGIRRVVLGGEAARGSDVASFRRHFRSDCVFVNGYGLTESTMALHYQVDEETSVPGETVPVGYAVEGAQVSLEQAGGEQVAVYGMGEIVLRSDALSLGYWQRAERTAAAFASDPEAPGRRVLRTGDLGRRLPGGALEVVGRRDHQVKIRGNRVELGEIEVVLGLHPALKQAVVVAAPGEGPDDTRLVAHLVAREARPSADELRAYLRARVPEYMIPSAWAWREAMPLLPGGKIDRRALPSAAPGLPAGERAFAAPRTPAERVLAGIWAELLKLEEVGRDDDFFALGGHSMLAVRLFARIEERFGRRLPLATLFEAPTIGQLASLLARGEWAPSWSSLIPISTTGSRRPFFCVHAFGGNVLNFRLLSRHLGDDQPFYGLQSRGLGGGEAPHERIEEMAAAYLDEIRAVQPRGPYALGGSSSGGVIAYEMAQQLHARGERVAALVLFDTKRVGPPSARLTRTLAASPLHRLAVLLDYHAGHLLLRRPRAGLAYLASKVRERLGGETDPLDEIRRTGPPAVRRVIEKNLAALRSYTPRPYPGRAVMLLSSEEPDRAFYDWRLAWADLVEGGLSVRFIPGSHENMLDEPQVSEVAAVLARCLEDGG